jgi:predicted nucleotidyltransferase
MSRIEAQQIVRKYAAKLKAEKYPFSAIYLFGSFINGVPDEGSDIDVAVVSDEVRKNWRKGKAQLWKFAEGVDIRIEPHGFSPEDFKQDWMPMVHEIKKTGIRIL